MSSPEDALETFCEDIDARGAERVVVRWIDEKRPVDEEEGVTVKQVRRATLKTAVDGEMIEETFEGLDYRTLKKVVEGWEFDVLFRSDNLTRR